MKEKLINKLYEFWRSNDDDKDTLLQEITNNVNNGVDGANVLLDWCRCDFESVRNEYKRLHNLTDDEMEKILGENYGGYGFIKDETDILNRAYINDLDNIWELCNHYLDYCNGDITEQDIERNIERC